MPIAAKVNADLGIPLTPSRNLQVAHSFAAQHLFVFFVAFCRIPRTALQKDQQKETKRTKDQG